MEIFKQGNIQKDNLEYNGICYRRNENKKKLIAFEMGFWKCNRNIRLHKVSNRTLREIMEFNRNILMKFGKYNC